MIWLATLLLAPGPYDPAPALVYGVGSQSCKLLIDEHGHGPATDWALAAWSGRNGEFGHVGDTLGEKGIIAGVLKHCDPSHTFTTIALATERAFKAAKAARR